MQHVLMWVGAGVTLILALALTDSGGRNDGGAHTRWGAILAIAALLMAHWA